MSGPTVVHRAQVWHGDCLEVLPQMGAESVDAVVTDPPYHLTCKQNWSLFPAHFNGSSDKRSANRGFMGQTWDGGDVAFRPETWAAVARVMKPGAHLLAFSGTRTYHRLACAVEDAGFEIRDAIMWHYASGFPKSHNIGKAIDRMAGAEREVVGTTIAPRKALDRYPDVAKYGYRTGELDITAPATPEAAAWEGWGTALKPATEIIVLARKPLRERTVAAQVLATGTGALNVDAARVPAPAGDREEYGIDGDESAGRNRNVYSSHDAQRTPYTRPAAGRWPANLAHDGSPEVLAAFAAFGFDGDASPARSFQAAPWTEEELLSSRANAIMSECRTRFAPIAKSHSAPSGREIASALTHAVTQASHGAIRLDDTQGLGESDTEKNTTLLLRSVITTILNIEQSAKLGRLPDGLSQSVSPARVAVHQTGTATMTITVSRWKSDGSVDPVTCSITLTRPVLLGAQSADLRRFHFSAKADTSDRAGSGHPTIKPLALMEWLTRFVCPPGGTVLDPFAGTGVTGEACLRQSFNAVLIEREADYHRDILYRMGRLSGADAPLFSWEAA